MDRKTTKNEWSEKLTWAKGWPGQPCLGQHAHFGLSLFCKIWIWKTLFKSKIKINQKRKQKFNNKHSLWNVKNCIISISLEYVHKNLVQLYKNIKPANRGLKPTTPSFIWNQDLKFRTVRTTYQIGWLRSWSYNFKSKYWGEMDACLGDQCLWILWVSIPYPQIHILIWNSNKLLELNMKIWL